MKRSAALWIVLALLGIVLTAGITAAASRLSSQHVGLSSEPLSAGDRLAPTAVRSRQSGQRVEGKTPQRARRKRATATSPSRTTPRFTPTDRAAGSDESAKRAGGSGDGDADSDDD